MRRYLPGLAAVLLWGVSPVALKQLAVHVPAGLLATAMYALVAGLTLPWLFRALRRRDVPWRTWTQLFAIGVLLTSAFNVLTAWAAQGVRGTTIGAVVALEPAMVALVAAVLARRWLSATTLGGLALSLAGVWLLLGAANAPAAQRDEGWAVTLVVLGALLWSLATVLAGRLRLPWRPLDTSMVLVCCGSLPFLLAAPLLSGWDRLPLDAATGAGILYMALGATVLANVLWLQSQRELGPVANGLLINLIPLGTFATAALWLHEPWGPRQLAGAALIVAGLTLGNLRPAAARARPVVGNG